jgi:putative transcriptional regulator
MGVTQSALAEGIGVTQGNVSMYEKGQTVPPHIAERVIAYAKKQGLLITFNDVYAVQGLKAPRRGTATAVA